MIFFLEFIFTIAKGFVITDVAIPLGSFSLMVMTISFSISSIFSKHESNPLNPRIQKSVL